MYDTQTVPVKSAPGAECVTVTDGKITHSRLLFDQAPVRRRPERRELTAARVPQAATRLSAHRRNCKIHSWPGDAPPAGLVTPGRPGPPKGRGAARLAQVEEA